MSKMGGKPPGRKRGGGGEEEHVNHERWMVSYADMLTVLFALFIVLYAMSTVDQEKYEQLAEGLAQGFGARSAAFAGKTGTMEGAPKAVSAIPLAGGADPKLKESALGKPDVVSKDDAAARAAVAEAERAQADLDARAAVNEVKNLKKIQEQIKAALRKQNVTKDVLFAINERGLVVTVVSSDVVFTGDRAELRPGGRRIMQAIGPALKSLPNNIAVDGHTNQLNVPTRVYPSSWELSTARASIVVRALAGQGLAKKRLTAAGHADTQPLIDPADPRSVSMNRRVDIVVLSDLTATQRELLPLLAAPATGKGAE